MRDIAELAGVGPATVDRVLNRRAPVRQATAERVLAAAEELNYHAARLIKHRVRELAPVRKLGFILQKRQKWFYQSLATSIREAAAMCPEIRAEVDIRFVEVLSPDALASTLIELSVESDAVAMVSIDHPRITEAIARCADGSVPVFALLSQLSAPQISGYVGIDSRKAGRTAGWFMAHPAGDRHEVGLLVGSHRYLGHEAQELGFRGYMREYSPRTRLHDSLIFLDDGEIAYEATAEILSRNPRLSGLYHCGGGVSGATRALRESGRERDIFYICHGRSPCACQGLLDGIVDLIIASPVEVLARQVTQSMALCLTGRKQELSRVPLDFQLIISENL